MLTLIAAGRPAARWWSCWVPAPSQKPAKLDPLQGGGLMKNVRNAETPDSPLLVPPPCLAFPQAQRLTTSPLFRHSRALPLLPLLPPPPPLPPQEIDRLAGENESLADKEKAASGQAERLRQDADSLRSQLGQATRELKETKAALAGAQAQAKSNAEAAAAAAAAAANQASTVTAPEDSGALKKVQAELLQTQAQLRKAEAVSPRSVHVYIAGRHFMYMMLLCTNDLWRACLYDDVVCVGLRLLTTTLITIAATDPTVAADRTSRPSSTRRRST